MGESSLRAATRQYRSALFVATVVAIWSTNCASAEFVEMCDLSDRYWEISLFWSNDDEKLAKYAEDVRDVCDKYIVKNISADDANALIASFDNTSIKLSLIEQQDANPAVKYWVVSLYLTSKIVGRDMAPYWLVWFLAGIPGAVFAAIYYLRKKMLAPLLAFESAHLVAFLMLLAGGFVAFFKVLGIMVSVVSTAIVIVQAAREFFRRSE